MRDFRDSKAIAKTLREAFAARSVLITHSESLELVAQAFGLQDWNILAARIEAERAMTAAPPARNFLPLGQAKLATALVRPFIPGGADYDLARQFYQTLGFTQTFDAGEIAGFFSDGGSFLLLRTREGFAPETMTLQLVVDDLDAWWAHLQALDLPTRFGVGEARGPTLEPWGLTIAYLPAPGGVVWQVTQR